MNPSSNPPLITDIIAINERLIEAKNELIAQQKAMIELLQNQLDQMKYSTTEREQNPHTDPKERKTA